MAKDQTSMQIWSTFLDFSWFFFPLKMEFELLADRVVLVEIQMFHMLFWNVQRKFLACFLHSN